jgi:hypothetical protein
MRIDRLGLAFVGLVAAGAGCSTYSVRRAALAPHIAPPMRSGQGMDDSAVEVALNSSTVASAAEPLEGDGANAGLYIPRVHLGAALRGRLNPNFDFGLIWDHGFREGAYATSEDQPSPDNGSVYGGGFTSYASIPTGTPGLRFGLALDLMVYSVPYVEYRTCVENCGGVTFTDVTHDRDAIGVYSFSLIPSYRVGRVTLFGGVTLRNHPTVEKGGIEGSLDFDDEVTAGPANYVLHAGTEVELGGGVRAMGIVYQPVSQDPVAYGPTLALSLSVRLAKPPAPIPQQPYQPPPPDPYYAPPPPPQPVYPPPAPP